LDGIYTVAEFLAKFPPRPAPPPPTRDTNPEGRRLTYAELVAREPRLADLRRFVAAQQPGQPDYCANRAWFRAPGFKAALCRIIGDEADQEDAALRTSAAYDVAYHTLYHALPGGGGEGGCYTGRNHA